MTANVQSTSDTRSLPGIDVDRDEDVQAWARKFDVTPEQIHEAVQAVGPKAEEVEMYLKGSRATTNADVEERADDMSAPKGS